MNETPVWLQWQLQWRRMQGGRLEEDFFMMLKAAQKANVNSRMLWTKCMLAAPFWYMYYVYVSLIVCCTYCLKLISLHLHSKDI